MRKILWLYIGVLTTINFANSLDNKYYTQIPNIPVFPVISTRMKMLDQDFIGVISDIESDITMNPSLLSLLKYNEVGVTILPYIKDNIGFPVSLYFLYPKLFSSRVGFGFQNQYEHSSAATNYITNDLYTHKQYEFWAYQHLFFLSFSVTPKLNLAPFYTTINSRYQNENEYNFPLEASDSFNYTHYSISRFNNNFHSQQVGLGMKYGWKNNSLEFSISLQKERNQDNGTGLDSTWGIYNWTYSNIFDSSYHYYLDKTIYFDKYMDNNQGTRQNNILRLAARWSKEVNNNDRINSIFDFDYNSGVPISSNYDSILHFSLDSSYHRWRNYPYSESTMVIVENEQTYDKHFNDISGKYTETKLSVGVGCENAITKFIQGFVGFESIFSLDNDSTLKEYIDIESANGVSDTQKTFTYSINRSKYVVISVPVGWEYKMFSPLIIRWGMTPTVSLEWTKAKLDYETMYYNSHYETLEWKYAIGLEYKVNKTLSLNAYNIGNLFNIKEFALQVKYIF